MINFKLFAPSLKELNCACKKSCVTHLLTQATNLSINLHLLIYRENIIDLHRSSPQSVSCEDDNQHVYSLVQMADQLCLCTFYPLFFSHHLTVSFALSLSLRYSSSRRGRTDTESNRGLLYQRQDATDSQLQ